MELRTSIFILVVLVLNLVQSAFTPLTGDEALYWMYWNNPAAGYRDHPPAIAMLIGPGYMLLKNELGLRLLVAISNALSIWLLWRLVKPRSFLSFALVVLSIPLLCLYGFIATPDAPLLLATVLYLTVWKKFLNNPSLRHSLLLGCCMAALVWSKYPGLLVIVFTALPHPRLWFHPQFWLAALVGVGLYSPHLLWQIEHGFPTVKFHLTGRNSDAWEMGHILGYVGGQFLVFNPVVLFLVIRQLWISKANCDFEKSTRWMIAGMLLIFFFNSFRGRVEPHWTAPAAFAIVYILGTRLIVSRRMQWSLAFITGLVFVVRAGLIWDIFPPLRREFHAPQKRIAAVRREAGNLPVCFTNSYQLPSLYTFYTGVPAHSINDVEGGKNQYDFWSYNEYCHLKPFMLAAGYPAPAAEKRVIPGFEFYVRQFDNLQLMHALNIHTQGNRFDAVAGETTTIPATVVNNNSYSLAFTDVAHPVEWMLLINHKKPGAATCEVVLDGLPGSLAPGDSADVQIRFEMPGNPGSNKGRIAARVGGLSATYQSNEVYLETR